MIKLERISIMPTPKKIKEWEKKDMEEEKLRKKSANWKFIKKLPKNEMESLNKFIETGDILYSAKEGRISPLKLNNLRIRASIPYFSG